MGTGDDGKLVVVRSRLEPGDKTGCCAGSTDSFGMAWHNLCTGVRVLVIRDRPSLNMVSRVESETFNWLFTATMLLCKFVIVVC